MLTPWAYYLRPVCSISLLCVYYSSLIFSSITIHYRDLPDMRNSFLRDVIFICLVRKTISFHRTQKDYLNAFLKNIILNIHLLYRL